MKRIVLTGGGSGGHVYPLLAVADALARLSGDLEVELVYVGPKDRYEEEFAERNIRFSPIISSKLRRYFSLSNFVDIPKFFLSLVQALCKLYFLMPDVVFSKGGPGALPIVLAARFYLIPVVIHESDTVPGLTGRVSGKFAKKIEISFEECRAYFKKRERVNLVGNPVVRETWTGMPLQKDDAKGKLGFDKSLPLIVVMGGSQGATRINQFIFDNFEALLKDYQIYHQVGPANFEEAKLLTESLSREMSSLYSSRYKLVGFFDTEGLRTAYSAADVVLSRSGSASIFEAAFFGKPSILVPLPEAAGNHQKINAYAYAATGAAVVVEEDNLKLNVVLVKLKDILGDAGTYEKMSAAAKVFAKPDAADLIAKDILLLCSGKK